MTVATKRSRREAAAITRRNSERDSRKAAHAAMQAQHAARREAIRLYEEANEAWYEGGKIGPQPLDPRYRDRALFPENFRY